MCTVTIQINKLTKKLLVAKNLPIFLFLILPILSIMGTSKLYEK